MMMPGLQPGLWWSECNACAGSCGRVMAEPATKQVDSEFSGAATNARKKAVAFTGAKSNPVAIDVTILAAGPLQQGQAAAGSTASDMPGKRGQEEATEGADGGGEAAMAHLSAAAGNKPRTSPDATAAAGLLMDLAGMDMGWWHSTQVQGPVPISSLHIAAHRSLFLAEDLSACTAAGQICR